MSARWSETGAPATRLAFCVAFVAFFMLGLFAWPAAFPADVRQPFEYNHRIHTDAKIPCTVCHTTVLSAAKPGLPNNATCYECHQQKLSDSPNEPILQEWLAGDEEIPWHRLFRQPSHVYFSHQRHAGVGQLECSTCHGEFGQLERPPVRQPRKLTMDACLDCHVQNEVVDDCSSCHR